MKKNEKNPSNREILTDSIKRQFNGALLLKKSQASTILNRSIPSLDRDRANFKGPEFKKDKAGNIYYPVHSLVEWLLDTEVTMTSNRFNNE